MRVILALALAIAILSPMRAEEPVKTAPKIVLKSPDGKKVYDLQKLTENGPVLIRLTCACSGCDQELPYFKKLQKAYNKQGLKTVAVFREKPEALEQYATKNGLNFFWLADPKGKMWKTFDATKMPTNVLIGKGGKIVRVIPGCKRDGSNAQKLSKEIAELLKAPVATVVPKK